MRATEQTLEHELAPILGERFGASVVTQGSHSAGRSRGQSDTILKFPDGSKIVLELEVGESHLLGGVVQAEGYLRPKNTICSTSFAQQKNLPLVKLPRFAISFLFFKNQTQRQKNHRHIARLFI
jgi:hypothetical protein